MIFEFANGGTLRIHLMQHFRSLKWKDKYKLGLEITNGLRYMHELDIIHKDLVSCDYAYVAHHYTNDYKLIIVMPFAVFLQYSYEIWYCKNH